MEHAHTPERLTLGMPTQGITLQGFVVAHTDPIQIPSLLAFCHGS